MYHSRVYSASVYLVEHVQVHLFKMRVFGPNCSMPDLGTLDQVPIMYRERRSTWKDIAGLGFDTRPSFRSFGWTLHSIGVWKMTPMFMVDKSLFFIPCVGFKYISVVFLSELCALMKRAMNRPTRPLKWLRKVIILLSCVSNVYILNPWKDSSFP